jgi:hypothetical protein
MAKSIEFDANRVLGRLDVLRSTQINYAGRQALKQLGWDLKQHHRQQMANIFEKPVPFTLSSPRYRADGLELYFRISTDGPKGQDPARYLYPVSTQDSAGRKPVYQTRFAKFLQKEGITTLHPIPYLRGRGVRKTSYGNMSPAQYSQVKAGLLRQDGSYFSIPDNRRTSARRTTLKPGIYQRKAKSINMLFGYTPTVPTIPATYDFFGLTSSYAQKHFPTILSKALDNALR